MVIHNNFILLLQVKSTTSTILLYSRDHKGFHFPAKNNKISPNKPVTFFLHSSLTVLVWHNQRQNIPSWLLACLLAYGFRHVYSNPIMDNGTSLITLLFVPNTCLFANYVLFRHHGLTFVNHFFLQCHGGLGRVSMADYYIMLILVVIGLITEVPLILFFICNIIHNLVAFFPLM